jgi:hypothetical protein
MGAETGVGSFGELASGVYYVGGHVFGGELGGYGYLGDDMLHLWKHNSERKACAPCIIWGRTWGTNASLMSEVTMVLLPTPSRKRSAVVLSFVTRTRI